MKAHFSRIQRLLSDKIVSSKSQIDIAVAWFTNKELLQYLIEKQITNIQIRILISSDRINNQIDFSQARRAGCEILILKSERFLHEKFALFDNQCLITGSYNWTNNAEHWNHESVIESADDLLLKQYAIRFKNLWNLAGEFDASKLTGDRSRGFDEKEKEFKELEAQLEKEILETIDELNKLGVPIKKTIVLDMIHNYGAIGACRKVLERGNDEENLPSGFLKLVEANRIDQSFEYRMTTDKYRSLFPEEDVKKAEERIKRYSQ